jgi:prepilin-type N-terminal cleavage/methylation domain-containing protein
MEDLRPGRLDRGTVPGPTGEGCVDTGTRIEAMKMLNRRQAGFTLIEIMIVVAIIGLLMAVAIPNLGRARRTTQAKVCVANLRMIQSAKQQWALENGKSDSDTPSEQELLPFIENEMFPKCPAGGTYTINPVGTYPTCSKAADGHAVGK